MADIKFKLDHGLIAALTLLSPLQVSAAMAQGSGTIANGEERRIEFSTLQPSQTEQGQPASSQSGVKYGTIHSRHTSYSFRARRGEVVSVAASNLSHQENAALTEIRVLKDGSEICLGRQVVALEFRTVLYDCSIPADGAYTMRVGLSDSVIIKMSSVYNEPKPLGEVEADTARRQQAYILNQNKLLSSFLSSFPTLSMGKIISGSVSTSKGSNQSGAKFVANAAGKVAFMVSGRDFVPNVKVTMVSKSGEFGEITVKNASGSRVVRFAAPVIQGQVLGITVESSAAYTGTGEYTIEAINGAE